ncbi:ferredoxin reductase [Solicola gregarius]|uniref:Ferredoxin reductase n=1 Tax=Solicola gregarius TaxID=2908642 RepID=A0AA46TI13_9ACTN|nr:ferredoxin reductase [Solicola gregarius]UYM05556.1 ferredoxin reductase [Solicola gregarius]
MARTRSTRGLARRLLASSFVDSLTTPHSIDRFLEHVHPMLTVHDVRARVVEVTHETGLASTVVLEPNDAWDHFTPGQHVQFGVEVDGKRRIRCFSVSSSAYRDDGRFSVTVKVHPDGYVSQFLRHELRAGTLVHLSRAEGEFVLPATVPDDLLLISGGSGVTPVMSMLRSLRDGGHSRPVTFLHYARTRDDEIFAAELDEIEASCPWVTMVRVYTRTPRGQDIEGRFNVDHLKHLGHDPADTPTYVCGPAGLIAVVRDAYDEAGAAERLQLEYFKVPTIDLDAADATGTLTLDDSNQEVDNSGNTILEQAEAAGLTPEFGCRMGICHKCTTRKKFGAVRNVISGEVRADTDEEITICNNVPVGDVSVAL